MEFIEAEDGDRVEPPVRVISPKKCGYARVPACSSPPVSPDAEEQRYSDEDLMLALKYARRVNGELRGLLRRLCSWRALTAEELALLTGRRKDYLVKKHLTPMVEARQLEYTNPAMPRHPDQAYRSADHR